MRPRSRKSEALADTINKNQTVAHNTQPNISYSTVIVDSPFPDPKILQKYKEILPGLAEKIISLAENEQRMRHEIDIANIELEKEATLAAVKKNKRLELYWIIVLIIWSITIIIALSNANNTKVFITSASILGITLLCSIVMVLIESANDSSGISLDKRNTNDNKECSEPQK